MHNILENIVKPVTRRLGTVAGAWLVAQGVDEHLAAQLINACLALVLVGIDLVMSYRDRNNG